MPETTTAPAPPDAASEPRHAGEPAAGVEISADVAAAIAEHRAAFDAFQVAPAGPETVAAERAYDAASDRVVWTFCPTWPDATAMLAHLRWWVGEEAEQAEALEPAYSLARMRVADLELYEAAPATLIALRAVLPFARRRRYDLEVVAGIVEAPDQGARPKARASQEAKALAKRAGASLDAADALLDAMKIPTSPPDLQL